MECIPQNSRRLSSQPATRASRDSGNGLRKTELTNEALTHAERRFSVLAAVSPGKAILSFLCTGTPNGYAYVYVSNQSDQDVYFDNLQVGLTAGNIIEEDHYYAFGLKIAGISSKKLGDSFEGLLKNNNLYNDKELFDDGDLNWYDYQLRNYDPQIGRWIQQNPLHILKLVLNLINGVSVHHLQQTFQNQNLCIQICQRLYFQELRHLFILV